MLTLKRRSETDAADTQENRHPRKSKLRASNIHITLKQVSISSFQENLAPKRKYIPNAMKLGTQSRFSSLIVSMI